MKKLKGWNWDDEEKVYVQNGFVVKDLDDQLGTNEHGDVKGKLTYDSNSVRWYNSFEQAQQVRFMVALHWSKSRFSHISNVEKKKRKKLILDLGCSRSFIYRKWKGNCNYFGWPMIHYFGVDSSLKRINEGRVSFVKKRNDSVFYFLGNLSKFMEFPVKADVIFCLEVLEHLSKDRASVLLKTIHRGLSDQGSAIISSPNPSEVGGWVWGESSKSHYYEYTFTEVQKLLEDHGFKITKKTGVLPDRNYFRKNSFPKLRKRLVEHLPAPVVNNILLLAENDMGKKRQWICEIQKK